MKVSKKEPRINHVAFGRGMSQHNNVSATRKSVTSNMSGQNEQLRKSSQPFIKIQNQEEEGPFDTNKNVRKLIHGRSQSEYESGGIPKVKSQNFMLGNQVEQLRQEGLLKESPQNPKTAARESRVSLHRTNDEKDAQNFRITNLHTAQRAILKLERSIERKSDQGDFALAQPNTAREMPTVYQQIGTAEKATSEHSLERNTGSTKVSFIQKNIANVQEKRSSKLATLSSPKMSIKLGGTYSAKDLVALKSSGLNQKKVNQSAKGMARSNSSQNTVGLKGINLHKARQAIDSPTKMVPKMAEKAEEAHHVKERAKGASKKNEIKSLIVVNPSSFQNEQVPPSYLDSYRYRNQVLSSKKLGSSSQLGKSQTRDGSQFKTPIEKDKSRQPGSELSQNSLVRRSKKERKQEIRDKSTDTKPHINQFASPLTQQEPLNVNKEGEIGVLEELPDSRLKANISPITALSNPRISRQQRKQLSQNLSNNNGSALGSRSITDHSPMMVEQGNTGGKLLPESKVSSSLSTQMSDFKSKLSS